jgi:hypothetical protein
MRGRARTDVLENDENSREHGEDQKHEQGQSTPSRRSLQRLRRHSAILLSGNGLVSVICHLHLRIGLISVARTVVVLESRSAQSGHHQRTGFSRSFMWRAEPTSWDRGLCDRAERAERNSNWTSDDVILPAWMFWS